MRASVWLWIVALLSLAPSSAGATEPTQAPSNNSEIASQPERTGEQIYLAACAACHAPDGKGQPQSILGFEPPSTFPNFTDCAVSTPENDYIWRSIVHLGGRVRAESHIMPAFGDVLTDREIEGVVKHLRSFCSERNWPQGNLNFPRAFSTEKAFPENEVVFTMNAVASHGHGVENRVDYEHRIGRRAQYELGVPFVLQQGDASQWSRGLGDINAAFKYAFYDDNRRGTIAAAGGEVTLPTGKESEGIGGGVTILEAFAMIDQALPHDAFIQFHGGFERPTDHDIAPNAFYWRTAIGKTFKQNGWGRTWSPMLEILGDKDIEDGAAAHWDLAPQLQVSLSTFQHVLLSAGYQTPINERDSRGGTFKVYLLWDWFDGPLFSMWRAH